MMRHKLITATDRRRWIALVAGDGLVAQSGLVVAQRSVAQQTPVEDEIFTEIKVGVCSFVATTCQEGVIGRNVEALFRVGLTLPDG